MPLPTSKYDLATFDIIIKGKRINPDIDILSIQVHKQINQIGRAEIQLRLPQKPGRVPVLTARKGTDLSPGQEIEIQAGYDGKNETIFKGLIVQQNAQIDANDGATIVLECHHKAIEMSITRATQYFANIKDSEAISQVVAANGLPFEVQNTSDEIEQLIQYQQTDWDFITSRAAINDMFVFTENGKLHLEKASTTGKPQLVITNGKDALSFRASIAHNFASKQRNKSTPQHQGQLEEKTNPLANKGGSAFAFRKMAQKSTLPMQKESLASRTKTKILKGQSQAISGQVSFMGNAKAKLNTILELNDFGSSYDGKVLTTAVQHRLEAGNWHTTVDFGLPGAPAELAPDISPLPDMQGLLEGLVLDSTADPSGQYRIKVHLPQIDPDGLGIWARLATFYASNEHGAFFIPEVGDEVIVGFVHDDIHDPIILGSMYSSTRPAPYPSQSENNIRAISTRSGMKIEFEEEDKIINISTPALNQLVLSEKDEHITLQDQNGNFLKLTKDGIILSSAKDLTLLANGKIDLQSQFGLTAKATRGDLNLEGSGISVKANTSFKATGTASAELSSSGITTVKGSMVMIN